jgi:predicted transcriptional regulator
MNTLWTSDAELSVQEVCSRLRSNNNYKTVMTVLNRMVEKSLLDRRLDGRSYRYHPQMSRDKFLEGLSLDMVRNFVRTYGVGAATHVSDALTVVASGSVSPPAVGVARPSLPFRGVREESNRRGSGFLRIAIVGFMLLQIIRYLRRRS